MEALAKDKERVAKASPTGFSGNLAIVPIMDVLEKVKNQRETGVLAVATPMVKGTVWIRRGDAVDAELGVRRGVHALDVLALLDEGSFNFEVRDVDGWEPTIDVPSSEIIKRWREAEPEFKAQLARLPRLLDQLFWPESKDPAELAAGEEERTVLLHLRQGCTLLEVMVESGQELKRVLGALATASELFEKSNKDGCSNPPGDKHSPRPVWTAPPPAVGAKTQIGTGSLPAAAKEAVGTLGQHTSANPRRRFLVPSSSTPAPATPNGSTTPKATGPKLGARTLVGVPMSSVLEASNGPSSDPLDGVVGEMIDAPPETIRTSTPPREHLVTPPVAEPPQQGRVIPRAQWDGRRNVGGVLELGDRRFTKVRTLATGNRFVCELVDELQGVESTRWVLKMPVRVARDAFVSLESESRHLSHMKHHAIVEFGLAGKDVETPYLFTHYHSGLTLLALHERVGKLPWPVIGAIAKQILQALVYMHDSARHHGAMVHANLCPENVLVGWDGTVKLTGFSLAQPVSKGRMDGDIRVQARYASPELLRGDAFDGRADVFSVGAMLRLLGDYSGKGETRRGTETLTRRAVEADVELRYPNAAQMLQDLGELANVYSVQELSSWLAQQGIKEGLAGPAKTADGRQSSATNGSSNKSRKRWLLFLVGALVLLGILAAVGFGLSG